MKSKKNFQNRWKALQHEMGANKIDVCCIDYPIDLFYYTGMKLSAGRLMMGRKEACLFVDGRYIDAAKQNSPFPVALDQPAAQVEFLNSCQGEVFAFDGGKTPYEQYLRLEGLLGKVKKRSWSLQSQGAFFKALRLMKDSGEIALMQKSARLVYRGFKFITEQLRKGVTELEVARSFELFCLENGAEKLAFEPIIAFGANSAMPHYHPGNRRLKKGDLVLIDIGVVVDQYYSDMTRVVFFGSIDPFLLSIYTIVREAHAAALKCIKPGVPIGELDAAARKVMRARGVEPHFLHTLGHGVGLEIHEYPRIKWDGEDKELRLKPGMVFTVEPGLYFPEVGGVRYEDTLVVTENGYRNFYPTFHKKDLLR